MCIKAEAKILLYLEYEAIKAGTSREDLTIDWVVMVRRQ
jgi:hypothetical protein